MDFSSTTAKVLGALGASAVVATSAGVVIDQSNKHSERNKAIFKEKINLIKNEANEDEKTDWFGAGLIKFLEDQDIIFKLFKDETTPLNESNFDFSNWTLKIKAKIFVGDNNDQFKESKDGKINVEVLKSLHKDKKWEWGCEFKFQKDPSADQKQLKDKDKFFNDKRNGFFDILTKELNPEDTQSRELKKKFIKDCLNASGTKRNKDRPSVASTTFNLKSKSDNFLYFIYSSGSLGSDPKKWFPGDFTVLTN